MKLFILGIIILAISTLTGCKSTSKVVINDEGLIDIVEEIPADVPVIPILPANLNGLIFRVEINRSVGFFKDNEEYTIHFFKYQNYFEITTLAPSSIASGSYEISKDGNIINLIIIDSRFGRGSMRFVFASDLEGEFTIMSMETTHGNSDHVANTHLPDSQDGSFKIVGSE